MGRPDARILAESRRPGRPLVLDEAERRLRILNAAEAAFLEKGYGATSMDDVAKACGMSKKTLYRSFTTKDLLFAELVETALRSLPDRPFDENEPEQDAPTTLRRALQSILEVILHPRQMALARLVIAEAAQTPELAVSLHERGLARAQRNLAGVIDDLRRRGLMRGQVGEDLGSYLLSATIGDRAITHLIGREAAPTPEEISRRIDRAFALFGPAIFIDRPSGSGHRTSRGEELPR